MNTEIKYRTLDQLLSEVSIDFAMYNNENFIEPSQMIKVAQRVTYDLGLRIHGTKEKVLDVCNNKVKLPDDFYVLNYAHILYNCTVTFRTPSGRQTENVILDRKPGDCGGTCCAKCSKCDDDCTCETTYVQECQSGEKIFVQVVEKRKYETYTYKHHGPLRIATDTGRVDALNDISGGATGYIKNGFIYTNFPDGKIFISYQGALEDDEGNLLVVDHPMINEYYEYAIKVRLLENLYISGEDVAQKIQLMEPRLRAARNNALSIVNTPDFAEMKKLWEMNRKAQYHKYYDMFKSYGYGY